MLPFPRTRSMRRLMTLVGTVAILFGTAGPALAASSPYYAAVWTTNGWWGVDGYIRQSGLTPVPSGEHHNVDIVICPALPIGYYCETDNIQTGELQGYSNLVSSPNTVTGYWEYNSSYCAYKELGFALSQPDTAFYIMYDWSGSHSTTCDGQSFTYYIFKVRDGCPTCQTLGTLFLPSAYGQISGQSEVLPQSLRIGYDYTGCDTSENCTDAGWGVHLYNGNWQLWNDSNDFNGPHHDDPPYYAQKQSYWAWETCPSGC
jgi:hypothetical protein